MEVLDLVPLVRRGLADVDAVGAVLEGVLALVLAEAVGEVVAGVGEEVVLGLGVGERGVQLLPGQG